MQLRDGKDPRAERDASRYEVRQAAATTKTVREVTMEWFTQKIASKSPAYRDKIYNQLHRYVYPTIGDVPIELMTTHAILYTRPKETVSNAPHGLYDHRHCLHELFSLMWPTARDVAFYYERIFKFAKKAGYFRGENPALWDTIKDLVPDKDDVYQRKNRDWLNYQDLPRFLEKLRAHQDRSVRKVGHPVIADALEVIALTAVRPAEVTQMQWREIDGDTWNVPPEHRKGRRAGRDDVRPIPITKSFREVLDRRRARCADPSGDALVFPSDKNNGKTGVGSFSTFIHNSLEWEYPISPHGFRSTLRDWRRAETEFKDILWQRQVDHRSGFADDDDGARTGDRSGAAYGHDPLLKPRRVMMEAYDDFGTPRLGGDVVVRMPRRRRVDDEA